MENKDPVPIKKLDIMPEVVSVKIEPVTVEPDFDTVKQKPSCNIAPEGPVIAIKKNPTNPEEIITIKVETITEAEQPINQDLDDEEFRYIFEDMCQKYSSHTQCSTSDKTYQQEPSRCNNTQIDMYKSNGINRHLRIYPYSCYICLKRYRIKENLDNHIRAHTGTQLVCDICKKEFIRKSLIIRHMRVHTREKPFRCKTCGKKFSQQCSLIRHEQIHSGTKHLCPICKNYFANASYLKLHARTHTGEKPYSCDVCQKAFPGSGGLKRHKQTQHKTKT